MVPTGYAIVGSDPKAGASDEGDAPSNEVDRVMGPDIVNGWVCWRGNVSCENFCLGRGVGDQKVEVI